METGVDTGRVAGRVSGRGAPLTGAAYPRRMAMLLHVLWDLSDPAATCTVDDLERAVHEGGLARFTGLDGMHSKIWFRDGHRYGSFMVFDSAQARDAVLPWISDRVRALCGLDPVRMEPFDVIAVASGAAGPLAADAPVAPAHG